MEASQSGSQTGQDAPSTAPQSETDAPAVAQDPGTQDSQLQTPQADQPIPPESERQQSEASSQDAAPVQDQGAPDKPSYPSNDDQHAAQEQREADRDRQRNEHAARTAGTEAPVGERQQLREEHLERTTVTETPAEPSEPAQADGNDGSQDAEQS